MKKIFKLLPLLVLTIAFTASCVNDDDYVIPPVKVPFFEENFEDITNNTNLDLTGWTNFAESGTWLWREKTFDGNGYAEFSAYNSGSSSNIVWLITPEIDLTNANNPGFKCEIAQHHLDVDSEENSLEILISTDFDGSNVLAANWTTLNANIPNSSVSWYEFVNSNIDLSFYNEKVHIAFKFRGSGTNTTLDGAFQVDNVIFYNEN